MELFPRHENFYAPESRKNVVPAILLIHSPDVLKSESMSLGRGLNTNFTKPSFCFPTQKPAFYFFKPMIAYLLHAANRNIKSYCDSYITAFYVIKDQLLKRYAQEDGYDIQKIPGKKCNSCGGKGRHPRYSSTPPYNIYDWNDCWHCFGGWYKFPKWICLQRYTFGSYTFHRPLKREECIHNPFTPDKMGWTVTDRPVIQGYIEHNKHRFGKIAVLLLFLRYNYPAFQSMLNDEIRWKRSKFRWWVQEKKRWVGWIFIKPPEIPIKSYYDDNFQHDMDLPF